APFEKQIILVDDFSTDGTREKLEKISADNIEKVFHEKNQGKGAAIQTAWPRVRGDVIVIQDADLEYDPSDFAALLGPIEKGQADVVFGSRFVGYPRRVLLFWHSVGNQLLTLLANMLNDLNLTDMEVGY